MQRCASGYTAISFETAQHYLSFEKVTTEFCVILDMDMPAMTGLELQKEISGIAGPPIIFLTGHGDVQPSIKAMKAGALEFL